MNPNEVVSPKSKIQQLEIIYDNKTFAIASMMWEGKKRIAIRWNGSKDNIGYPQSYGHPTWFIMPKEVALAYAQNLKNSKMENIIRASTDDPFA